MTIYSRPDEMVMAESALAGEVQDFPDILRGWGVAFDQTGGIPPMEWCNALAKRTDQAIRYLMQRGVSERSVTETYPAGARVQFTGLEYVALRDNTAKQPDASALDWLLGRTGVLIGVRVFTSSGTYIPSPGTNRVLVEVQGGGGGGGGVAATSARGPASRSAG